MIELKTVVVKNSEDGTLTILPTVLDFKLLKQRVSLLVYAITIAVAVCNFGVVSEIVYFYSRAKIQHLQMYNLPNGSSSTG